MTPWTGPVAWRYWKVTAVPPSLSDPPYALEVVDDVGKGRRLLREGV